MEKEGEGEREEREYLKTEQKKKECVGLSTF